MRNADIINNEINELKEKMASVQGSETEVYTRIVGYYRSVKNWNKGKRDEYNQRKLFSQPDKVSFKDAADTAVSTATFNETPEPQRAVLSDSVSDPASYVYFFRTTCPNCPPVRNWLENSHFSGEAVNVDEKEGFARAGSYRIFASPTVVFLDKEGREMYRASDTAALDALFAKVPV